MSNTKKIITALYAGTVTTLGAADILMLIRDAVCTAHDAIHCTPKKAAASDGFIFAATFLLGIAAYTWSRKSDFDLSEPANGNIRKIARIVLGCLGFALAIASIGILIKDLLCIESSSTCDTRDYLGIDGLSSGVAAACSLVFAAMIYFCGSSPPSRLENPAPAPAPETAPVIVIEPAPAPASTPVVASTPAPALVPVSASAPALASAPAVKIEPIAAPGLHS